MDNNLGKKTASGVAFKLLERISAMLISLVISVLLARILEPSDYGIIAMANVIIEILYVFVNYGLGTAVIHNKDASQEEISTGFWGAVLFGVIMYIVVCITSGPLAVYFNMPVLQPVVQIMGLTIVFAMINSILMALVAKQFLYRKYFLVTLIVSVLSGTVGVCMAYCGFGVWSLVIQTLCTNFMTTVCTSVLLRWKPSFVFSWRILKKQISYSWRLLLVGFVDCIYAELRSIIIAKKYTTEDLAFYNKGAQFPKLVANSVNHSIIAVLFPSMSVIQDDQEKVRSFAKQTLSLLSFFLFPIMIGLLSVSEEMVRLLLTEKWLFCVPYMQALCLAYMITPIQSVYKQVLKALGRTQMLLTVNICEKVLGVALLIMAMPYGVIAICWSFVVYHVVGLILYMISGQKVMGYKVFSQLKDLIPNVIMTIVMFVCIHFVSQLPIIGWLRMAVQILTGAFSYFLVALITRNKNLGVLLGGLKAHKKTNTA